MPTFTFAGVTYEQDDTPDQIDLLGGGVNLGGATFSSGFPSSITQSVGFQAVGTGSGGFIGETGFDPLLSVGQQAFAQEGITQPDGSGATYAAALNLPSGNVGSTVRHGIEMSWSDGRALVDGAGDEIVVFESATGTALSNDEAYMVRLELHDGSFTAWRYEKAGAGQQYFGQGDSANPTTFDLADFGVTSERVVGIQLANLISADRVSGSDGQGFVQFDGTGFLAQSRTGSAFASGALDPDPLYIGILSTADMVPVANTDPVARDDDFVTDEDSPTSGNVLTNTVPDGADSDADNDALTVVGVGVASGQVGTAVAGATGGLFTIAANGALSFDPDDDFEALAVGETATTTVTYTISDGAGTDSATVTVTIDGVNDAPVARDDGFATGEDSLLTSQNVITNTAPNGADSDVDTSDTLTVTAVAGLAGNVGTAVAGSTGGLFTIAANGALSFDPDDDYEALGVGETATSTVDYILSDGHGGTDGATVTVIINGVNDAPVARDDSFTTDEDSPKSGNVITNILPSGADGDVEGDTLTVVGVGVPLGQVGTAVAGSDGGTFTIQANGGLLFNPGSAFQALFTGQQATTTVEYTISDGNGGTDTAMVTVTVTGADEADIFTAGADVRDLNGFNLSLYTQAQATHALGAADVVQLSQTQNLGIDFHGNGGADTITGSSSTDRIHGDNAIDRLYGGNGGDSLWGGAGNDTLAGGNGEDVFAWEPGEGAQRDVVSDFIRNTDHIDLSSILDLGEVGSGDLDIDTSINGLVRIRVDSDDDPASTLDLEINVFVNNSTGWNIGTVGTAGAEIWLG